jgi:inner membrane protein
MPTVVGHALLGGVSGWALPREQVPIRAVWIGALCAAAPDADSVGFSLGVPYGHWLGHRGFSHSLVFAVLLAATVVAVYRLLPAYRGSRWVLAWYLAACTASHGLLDAMTDGGLGVAFFSPFSNRRFFLPWRPLVVSPLDVFSLFSAWGLRVLVSEALCIGIPVTLIVVARLAVGSGRGSRAGTRV